MGFRPSLDVIRVEFENADHPLHGLVMKLRPPSVGEFLDSIGSLELILAGEEAQDRAKNGTLTREWAESLSAQARHPFDMFASQLLEWNMEDPEPPHDPIPPTMEGFQRIAQRTMALIMHEARNAIMEVRPDLKDDSDSGDSSRMQQLPMDLG